MKLLETLTPEECAYPFEAAPFEIAFGIGELIKEMPNGDQSKLLVIFDPVINSITLPAGIIDEPAYRIGWAIATATYRGLESR